MNFSTPVELPKGLPPITHAQRLLLMGSCFAENIGRQLKENSFHCDVNPFGILYNPFSVLEALQGFGKSYCCRRTLVSGRTQAYLLHQ